MWSARGNELATPRIDRSVAPPGPTPNVADAMPTPERPPTTTAPQDIIPRDAARFRRTLVRVLAVQVVTLVLLWLLQVRFSS